MEKDMKLRKFIATTIREYLNEQVENSDNDLKILFDIAQKFDDPYKFDDYLNRNMQDPVHIVTTYPSDTLYLDKFSRKDRLLMKGKK
jgi:predicted nucleotidyltransferase